jgi:hypothetical protein
MLKPNEIKSIHIAKSKAGLSDKQYREILDEVAGVTSSKDSCLCARDYNEIMKRLTVSRPGWKPRQLGKFKQYAALCCMSKEESRAELYKTTGVMNEESPELGNEEFELVMSELEAKLEELVKAGKTVKPDRLDLRYWRDRLPNGRLSSRQDWELRSLWIKLSEFLPEEKRGYEYFFGLISRALNLKLNITDLYQLKAAQAVRAIDALKNRLSQEENRLSKDVPF